VSDRCDALVIGGGFFGLYLAQFLATRHDRVMVCERDADFMQRASYVNQARVHHGYHYPRSLLTAYRSRVNFPRFVEQFQPCIDSSFECCYAIASRLSKVSLEQFRRTMRLIGAPLEPAPPHLRGLFDSGYVQGVFQACEYAFNAVILKDLILESVRRAGVELSTRTVVTRLRQAALDAIEVELSREEGASTVVAGEVYSATYAHTNEVLAKSGLEPIPFKHELVELALVEVPKELSGVGMTVMCGPFFSCMPFPPLGVHSLSHVRYTPHVHWYDSGASSVSLAQRLASFEKVSAFPAMVRDAGRYVPLLRKCRYIDSLWDVKTVLPRSEIDDSRPILFRPHHGLRNLHVVMGAKLDNVYDVTDQLREAFPARESCRHVDG
jgi:glycine/D-amino acid oxidase-like deaminating enzyme